ncbi:hypothetical protein EAI88_07330 [Eubacterium ramulus]|nr:hypothetical protein EAI88_07330 [Eubacterium ramulus]
MSALFLERRVRENDEKETEKSPCTGDGSSYAGRCTIASNGCRSSTGGRSSDSGNTTGGCSSDSGNTTGGRSSDSGNTTGNRNAGS